MTVMRKHYLSRSGSGQHPTSDPPSRSTADRAPLARVQTSRRRAPTAHRRTRRIAPYRRQRRPVEPAHGATIAPPATAWKLLHQKKRRPISAERAGFLVEGRQRRAKREQTRSKPRTNQEQVRRRARETRGTANEPR
jgi:hypothetical protein